ncbi:MAG: helix-turn-helix transcriptional regulator, partial [Acidimicrobiales bacterium]
PGVERVVRDVFVSVGDVALALVVRAVIAAAVTGGWVVVADYPSEATVLVSDDIERDRALTRRRVIEVVSPFPRCASRAVAHLNAGESQGAILADWPASLATALAVDEREVLYSARLVALAKNFPGLTEREDAILALVAQGRSTAWISESLNLSVTSAKREIKTIQRRLQALDRPDLAARAVALGFPARRDLRDL